MLHPIKPWRREDVTGRGELKGKTEEGDSKDTAADAVQRRRRSRAAGGLGLPGFTTVRFPVGGRGVSIASLRAQPLGTAPLPPPPPAQRTR